MHKTPTPTPVSSGRVNFTGIVWVTGGGTPRMCWIRGDFLKFVGCSKGFYCITGFSQYGVSKFPFC